MFPYIHNLLKTDLFNGLSACDLERLIDFDSCILGKYTKNTLIIQEFDNCKSIGFILEGSLSVQQLSPTGDSITLNVLKQGDSFGEGLLFASESHYVFNLMTTSSTVVLYIPFDQIKKLLKESFDFSANYIAFLSNRLLLFKNKIQLLSHKDVRARLIIYLANECKRINSLSFKLAHTKTEIADLIGVARPSVSRELYRMQQDQLIKLDRKEIIILKPELISSKVLFSNKPFNFTSHNQ